MGDSFLEVLKRGLDQTGLVLDDQQLARCQKYQELLLSWNQKMNLTAIVDPGEVAVKHFIDSLICARYVDLAGGPLIDIGTGAGFPGLPLKVYASELEVTLLDSLAKRCQFLRQVVQDLRLAGVSVVHGRAEDKGRDPVFRERFFFAAARAVTGLPALVEYSLPFVRVGGIFLALKGPGAEGEVGEAGPALAVLGGRVREIQDYFLPLSGDKRSLVIIEKVFSTPGKYPRRAGLPEKKPML